MVPADATIKGAFKGVCSSGFATDYYIYGGTPPYRVTSTFPNSVTLVNSIVNTNGGFFEAITNGSCVDPLTFSIVDATGRQTTATAPQRRGDGRRTGGTAAGSSRDAAGDSGRRQLHRLRSFPSRYLGGTPPYNVTARHPARRQACPAVTLAAAGVATLDFRRVPIPATSITTICRQGLEQSAEEFRFTCDCN